MLMKKNERILVLGANGFIGSHLVDRLAQSHYIVRAFGRFENEPKFGQSDDIEIYQGDFLNQNDLAEALKGVSYVIHLISTTTPATSDKDPIIDLNTNVGGSITLFQKCIENSNIKRVVFASSGGTVYGDSYQGRPFKETDQTIPISPYGIGKLTIENYLNYYHRVYGQDYTVFRIANPYGGRQEYTKQQGIMPVLLRNISGGLPVIVYGDGTMVRDYIYIYDLVEIIAQSLERSLLFKTYNIGSSTGVSVNDLIAIAEKVTGKKADVKHKETPSTFVHTSILDNRRLCNEIHVNLTDVSQGVRAMYSNLAKHLAS